MITFKDITLGSKFVHCSGSVTEIVSVSVYVITGETLPSPTDTHLEGQSTRGKYLGITAAQQWADDFNLHNYIKIGKQDE